MNKTKNKIKRIKVTLEVENGKIVDICYDEKNSKHIKPVDCKTIAREHNSKQGMRHVATVLYSYQEDCCFIWNGQCYWIC